MWSCHCHAARRKERRVPPVLRRERSIMSGRHAPVRQARENSGDAICAREPDIAYPLLHRRKGSSPGRPVAHISNLLMLLPSGPDMVRGLYCTGPGARQSVDTSIRDRHLKKTFYGIRQAETSDSFFPLVLRWKTMLKRILYCNISADTNTGALTPHIGRKG